MRLKIDKAGRIVVPRTLRERLGLRAGMALEVGETPDGLFLKCVADTPSMTQEQGFWVHHGAPPAGFDWKRHSEEHLEDRHREVSGF